VLGFLTFRWESFVQGESNYWNTVDKKGRREKIQKPALFEFILAALNFEALRIDYLLF